MALYIISQILMGVGLIIDLSSRIMKNKKYILIYMTLASLFYISSYLCLLNPIPAISNACNLFRGISYLYLDKKNKPFKFYLIPMAIIFSSFAIAIGFLWRNEMDIIMIVSIVVCTTCLAFKNLLVVRIGLIANSLMWIPYNIYIASYMGAVTNILNVLFVLGAIIYYHVILPKKQVKSIQIENVNSNKTMVTNDTEQIDTTTE